jgi:hypothetical protein
MVGGQDHSKRLARPALVIHDQYGGSFGFLSHDILRSAAAKGMPSQRACPTAADRQVFSQLFDYQK